MRHPVLRLSFGSGSFKEPGFLHGNLMDQLNAIERRAGVVAESATAPGRFVHLLEALHAEAGQPVAVLVDEYDKPILDALEVPEIARANRDYLRGLYATIKNSDAHIAFTFLTGVSKFSKVSLFSGLNRRTWTRCSPRNCAAWTEMKYARGITATTGSATKPYTTPSTCCCYSSTVGSGPTGLRRVRRPYVNTGCRLDVT